MSDDDFLRWWHVHGTDAGTRNDATWMAANAVRYVLPVIAHFDGDVEKMMSALLAAPGGIWVYVSSPVSAVILGAVAGALYGVAALPKAWRQWAEPKAKPWLALGGVVKARAKKEREIVTVTERLTKPRKGGKSLLHDKIHGCILAGAIGNAMGSPVEGRFWWEVDEQHPGGIRTVLDPARLESEDDNQMAMLLVETYLEREGRPVLARHFGRTWQERLNRDHFYPLCMGNAYDLICAGWDPRITGHWSVVTGSTVMCMEPVGVFHAADPEFAAIDATAVSYMYQRGLDMTAATILAAAVAACLHPDATVDSVCKAALDASPRERWNTFDRRPIKSVHDYISKCLDIAGKYTDVLAARKELHDKCLLYSMIDPIELLGFSFAMFKIAKGDVRQAAIGGTNIGRDSDTISGRGAMLAGTLKGAGSVPKDWKALCSPESLKRIERNAARFAELVGVKKLERLKLRQDAAQ